MIVRDKPAFWEVFFILRGSVVLQVTPLIGAVAGSSLIVVILQRAGVTHITAISPLALSLIGGLLAIVASFRNTSAYDRWWEARKVTGLVVVDCRNLAREAPAYITETGDELSRRMALRCIAFMYAVRDFLRDIPVSDDLVRYLQPDELAAVQASKNRPNRLLGYLTRDIATALAENRVSDQLAKLLEERVNALSLAFAGAERTKVTPMPYVYTLGVHRMAYLFCLLLPFGLADSSGYWTPLLVAIISYAFFGLDAIGDELSMPFMSAHGLPLDAMSRVVEINILESLGETDLPAPLQPKRYVLT
ncbi:MAG TPA: bestrophin family ion channel [Pseudonocardiaceae bacterium]|jgi:putative membrane protein